jgi:regulatory protein
MQRQPPSLRGRALMWLAQREHTRHELAQKLRRWLQALHRRAAAQASQDPDATPAAPRACAPLPDAGEIDDLLDKLQADGHLSDQRFVESRVNARRARFGNRRIEQELQRHGTALDGASRAQLRASEAERARRVWALKYGQPAQSAAERARQMRFLAGRGFAADVIRRVVADARADDITDEGAEHPPPQAEG